MWFSQIIHKQVPVFIFTRRKKNDSSYVPIKWDFFFFFFFFFFFWGGGGGVGGGILKQQFVPTIKVTKPEIHIFLWLCVTSFFQSIKRNIALHFNFSGRIQCSHSKFDTTR